MLVGRSCCSQNSGHALCLHRLYNNSSVALYNLQHETVLSARKHSVTKEQHMRKGTAQVHKPGAPAANLLGCTLRYK